MTGGRDSAKGGVMKSVIRIFLVISLMPLGFLMAEDLKVKVSEQTFTKPAAWKSEKTASRMRAAQFSVPGKEGEEAAVCVFFYFGPGNGGGAQANLQRWVGQFAEDPKPEFKVDDAKVGEIPVAYLFANGTFMDGPPFGGAKVPKKNYGMAAAVLGTKPGYIFVKMTGPEAVVDAAKADFKKMIESALK